MRNLRMKAARDAARASALVRQAARREIARSDSQAKRAAKRAADREAARAKRARQRAREKAKAAKEAARRPRGRPPAKPRQTARWTLYSAEHPSRIYSAIMNGECRSEPDSISALFGVTRRTVADWEKRHPAFARAIDRAFSDRAARRGNFATCIVEAFDHSKINHAAKTERGMLGPALKTLRRTLDDARFDELDAAGHFDFHRLRRWRERPAPPERWLKSMRPQQRGSHVALAMRPAYWNIAVGLAEDGEAITGRALARRLLVGEATLRDWRRKYPAFDAKLLAAIDRGRRQRSLTL
jgi:hypothetical protein